MHTRNRNSPPRGQNARSRVPTRNSQILKSPPSHGHLDEAPIIETRQDQEPGAVLIASPKYGEVWVALTAEMTANLRAEEAQRLAPRAVLMVADIIALHGKPEAAIKATLEVFRIFGEAKVQ